MQELRLARREDDALIVTNDAGDEFQITIDEYVISEVKQAARGQRTGPRVKPREIQSLIRSGKTRDEVVAATGADESDVERHEGPVLAERRYILENALKVQVRSHNEAVDEEPQTFGGVIADRLESISAERIDWTSWRDDDAGWMVSLDFSSRDVDHRAVWSFDHRKALLAPLTSDAVTLSQQGDVGDRLIPKLRAVDTPERTERFDSGAFDAEDLAAILPDAEPASLAATLPLEFDDQGVIGAEEKLESAEAAYERRQEIDHRSISTREDEPADLGQTADLLDALRRRRGERENGRPESSLSSGSSEKESPTNLRDSRALPSEDAEKSTEKDPGALVKPSVKQKRQPNQSADQPDAPSTPSETPPKPVPPTTESIAGNKKRRTSIPSWDDILFGTRSEDDPV